MSTFEVDRALLADTLDKQAIRELVREERFWRDRGEWDKLAGCYTEDSHVKTTWFEGTAREFAAASKEMAERGRHSTHPIEPVHVRVKGDRALVESVAEIRNRGTIGGVEVDMVMYCRFFSRVQRTPEGWRLATFDGIYHKDAMAPVNPREALPVDWDDLRRRRPSYRAWACVLSSRGYDVGADELGDDRADLLEPFYSEAERWLEAGGSAGPGG